MRVTDALAAFALLRLFLGLGMAITEYIAGLGDELKTGVSKRLNDHLFTEM